MGPTLRRMTVPMVYGIVAILLFNLVDTYFVSLLGTRELAAIGFTFPVSMVLVNLGVGLGIGTAAIVARSLGGGQQDEARRLTTHSLILALGVVLAVVAIGLATMDPLFTALGAPADLLPLIRDYMGIYYIGSLFLLVPMVGNAALRATGNTRTPSILMGLAGLLNGILDPLLIFGLGPFPELGIRGAALATAIAWASTSAAGLWFLMRREQMLDLHWRGFASLWASWRRHVRISLPASAANTLVPIATGIITAMVARHGPEAVAAYGVGGRVESVALIVVLAMSMSLPPFISQNLGGGRIDRVREALRLSLGFVLAFELAVYLLLVGAAPWIAAAFTSDPEVDRLIRLFIYILPLSYGCQGVVILVNSSFNALHAPLKAVKLSILRLFVCYVPMAWLGSQLAGLGGLFAGAALGNLLVCVLAAVWIRRYCRHLAPSSPG